MYSINTRQFRNLNSHGIVTTPLLPQWIEFKLRSFSTGTVWVTENLMMVGHEQGFEYPKFRQNPLNLHRAIPKGRNCQLRPILNQYPSAVWLKNRSPR